MQFQDVEFMSAADKARVFKQWQRFVKSGFKRTLFTKALYSHLRTHFSFIAHYDINGFYLARFASPSGRVKTLHDICVKPAFGDYVDINAAMAACIQGDMAEHVSNACAQRIGDIESAIAKLDATLMMLKRQQHSRPRADVDGAA